MKDTINIKAEIADTGMVMGDKVPKTKAEKWFRHVKMEADTVRSGQHFQKHSCIHCARKRICGLFISKSLIEITVTKLVYRNNKQSEDKFGEGEGN